MTNAETEAINALAAQATGLLDVCADLKNGTAQRIADAVAASENAALIPLMTVATNLIDMQTLLTLYITRG